MLSKNMLIAVGTKQPETIMPSSRPEETQPTIKNQNRDGHKLNEISKWTRRMRSERCTIGDNKYKSTINITDIVIIP